MNWYVYCVRFEKWKGTAGYTWDLLRISSRRLKEHNSGKTKFQQKGMAFMDVIYTEEADSREKASKEILT